MKGWYIARTRGVKLHDVKFQTMVLPNGLIINLEEQWEGRRHDCVLYFTNGSIKLSQLSG